MIAVLDYGIGNLRSAQKALERVGADARLVTSPQQAEGATAVVLPGVGAFGACMAALRRSRLDEVARAAVEAGTPFLGICVGMQLLYEGSEEDPDEVGLGILEGRVQRLPDTVKRPQMQWNRLELHRPNDPLVQGLGPDPWVYFVHSYAAPPAAGVVATCDYGGAVPAIVSSARPPSQGGGPGERLWATQFHPEKSGPVGLALLTNFVNLAQPT